MARVVTMPIGEFVRRVERWLSGKEVVLMDEQRTLLNEALAIAEEVYSSREGDRG